MHPIRFYTRVEGSNRTGQNWLLVRASMRSLDLALPAVTIHAASVIVWSCASMSCKEEGP